MITRENKEQIQGIIQTLLEKMGFSAAVEPLDSVEGAIFNIKLEEAGFLIGESGANLAYLNHLVKKISANVLKNSEPLKFFLDVNDYQKQKNESLKELAQMTVKKVRYFKKEIVLEPMSSYERRVVHLALAEHPDIATESLGEEPERRVVVKPRE